MLTKRCYINHASRRLAQESTMKQVKTVILYVWLTNRQRLTMEHASAFAAETKASSRSFAILELTYAGVVYK